MEKRKYKLVAFILILSLIFPFFPSVKASAAISPMPDFPYGQNDFYNVNNGYFALWQIHNSDYINYVQTFTPIIPQSANPIIIFNKTWLYSTYTYYLDYNFIIDCWDSTGNHLSSLPVNKNIRVPRPNEDYVEDNVVYATLVFTTGDIWWTSGDGSGIYAYTNYYPDGYVDPTPIPTPEPEIDNYFPTFTNAYVLENQGSEDRFENIYLVANRYYDEVNTRYEYQLVFVSGHLHRGVDWRWYPVYTPSYEGYDFINNTLTFYFPNIATYANYGGQYGISFFTSANYKTESDIYDCTNFRSNNRGNNMEEPTERNYQFSITEPSMNYEATAIYKINSDGSTTRLDGDGGETPATPTPTAIPTAIPQPTTNPNPTATPVPDVKVVQPGDHWWDGLVKPIEYIFVPSKDKMMRTYNIMSEKFGVQKPTKFEFSVDSLVRPDNVVWKFKHASLNGSDNTETQITLIDFEMIDGWLETSAGRMIIRIIRAVFGLLMWAFLMYIYRKHIATINYTDAETLKDISRNSGGGDEDV